MVSAEFLAWLFGGGGLVTVGGLIWWNGKFNGKVLAELTGLRRDLNGPIKDKFDSAAKNIQSAAEKADAVHNAWLEQKPQCLLHEHTLVEIEKKLVIIDKWRERRDRKREEN